jgi:hypothetical protein
MSDELIKERDKVVLLMVYKSQKRRSFFIVIKNPVC